MPEEETVSEEQEAGESRAGLMGGVRGWIIVIAVVVLEAVFFLVYMSLRERSASKDEDEDVNVVHKLREYNRHLIRLEQLNYSIPTQGRNAVLSMSIIIVLGRSDAEIRQGVPISDEDWGKFEEAVKRMIPNIKDQLNQHVTQQTVNSLNSPSGKQKIKAFVAQYVNEELSRIDLNLDRKLDKRRVTGVLLPSFYLQH